MATQIDTKAQAIAAIERQIKEAKSEIAKKALKAKLQRLKEETEGETLTAKKLASVLLKQREKVRELSAKDFNALIKKLAAKPEYAFLKRYSRGMIIDDMKREAKPVGWRFKGRGNYRIPSKKQIEEGKRKGTVYKESRPRRSDVSFAAKLAQGGGVGYESLTLKYDFPKHKRTPATTVYLKPDTSSEIKVGGRGEAGYKLLYKNGNNSNLVITKRELDELTAGKTVVSSGGKVSISDKYATGGGVGERINEKDFEEGKSFILGNTKIILSKKQNPKYFTAEYIDTTDNEVIGVYGSPNFEDVRYDILTQKYANGGGVSNLKIGSVIKAEGFTMLKGLEGGNYYTVVDMDGYSATLVKSDKNGNKKGSKKVRHYLSFIESGIKTLSRGDNNGFEVIKYAKGGGVGDKMSFNEFTETLQEYEIEGGFGKTSEKGYKMYYLPKNNPYLNTTFKHRNKKKAYQEYLKMNKYSNGGGVGDSFNWSKMTYNQKLSLVRESGLEDKVAIKEVGMLTPQEISKLKNSVRLNRELKTVKMAQGGKLVIRNGREYPTGSAWEIEHSKRNKSEKWEQYEEGGEIDYFPQYDINEEGNFAATIGGKNYEIIYRDDVSQMYDLFQDGNKIASDTYLRNLMSFDKYDTDDMPVIRTQFEEDYFEYGDGGGISEKLVYQKWSKMMGGNGVSGTIRTTPENYYVATIDENGNILFGDLEANTRNINKAEVEKLWKQNKIKDVTPKSYGDSRDTYGHGGEMHKSEMMSNGGGIAKHNFKYEIFAENTKTGEKSTVAYVRAYGDVTLMISGLQKGVTSSPIKYGFKSL
jgi:hypothetical protein